VSELSCHPARPGSILDEVYGAERAGELKTLTETRVKETLRDAARARRQHRAPGTRAAGSRVPRRRPAVRPSGRGV